MPIIDDKGFAPDEWRRLGADEAPPPSGRILLPLERLEAEFAASRAGAALTLGADIPNTADAAALEPWLGRLALIAIAFPKFSDGRGFSLARRLRRLGYQGELRANGYLIADQYGFARSCGFDAIEISDALAARQPEAQWRAAAASQSLGYQPGYPGPQNILAARRAAQGEA